MCRDTESKVSNQGKPLYRTDDGHPADGILQQTHYIDE
jgi:hypothetical protein